MEEKHQLIEQLLEECGRLHGHICPGQLLGVRMSLLGCELIGIGEPKGADRKKLLVWVEIDRCMTDAVSAVCGVRLGRRSLKYVDYGKVAATFLNTETADAVRVAARDDSRTLADTRYPLIESKKERQLRAYLEASDEELFKIEKVSVKYQERDAPGHTRSRVSCSSCGEGINDGREISGTEGLKLCVPCAVGGYYQRVI
ncbi:MAG TPA: FmdE family protein [Pyrinomonadaceae bacterium]|jgi:formylmethanofuran dehydrogenase subunit E